MEGKMEEGKDFLQLAQDVLGLSIQTLKPNLTEAYGTNKYAEKARERKEELDVQRRSKYDQGPKNLKIFEPGTPIWVQSSESRKWKVKAKVVSKVRKRTYKIVFEDGRISYRNRPKIKIRVEHPNQSSNLEENHGDNMGRQDEDTEPHFQRSKRKKMSMPK